jgi:hypothetical protein
MAQVGGPLPGGGADEDEPKLVLELVGEFCHLSAFERKPDWGTTVARLALMVDGGLSYANSPYANLVC